MRGQRKNPRKAVQPFENKKRKIDIFKNYEANGVEKIQRKLEIFSTLISKKSSDKNQEAYSDLRRMSVAGHGANMQQKFPLPLHHKIKNKIKNKIKGGIRKLLS